MDTSTGQEAGIRSWKPQDPVASLHPTARRILDAALHLLETEGYGSLTVSRIAAEAGENKPTLYYYFGSKAGIVSALADVVVHDYTASVLQQIVGLPDGDKRVRAALRSHERIASDTRANMAQLEILFHAPRDKELREQVAKAYETYRNVNIAELTGETNSESLERYRALGALSLAVLDGLALQAVLAGDASDVHEAFEYWQSILLDLMRKDWAPESAEDGD